MVKKTNFLTQIKGISRKYIIKEYIDFGRENYLL